MAILRAGVLTVSDGCAKGEREDVSGQVLADGLREAGFAIAAQAVVPDDVETIAATLTQWCETGCDLILTTGGTGFAPRDITPEATRQVIERDAPGLAELLRWTGYQKLPRAVLSRGVAGIRGRTVLVNLPGSTGGVRDGLEVLLPLLPHAIALLQDEPVDHTPAKAAGTNETVTAETLSQQQNPAQTIAVLECNLDDFSPELYEVLMERLFTAGAVDVFLTPIQMKKARPATLLTVLVPPEKETDVVQTLFAESTTFGIRRTVKERYTLERTWKTVETSFGPVRIKIGTWQGTEMSASPEYEDVKAAAKTKNVPVKTVYTAALTALARAQEN